MIKMDSLYGKIKQEVKASLLEMNYTLEDDVLQAIEKACKEEKTVTGQKVLNRILQNVEIARRERIPLCQDTGMVWIYIRLGRQTPLPFSIEDCLDEAVLEAYKEGYFRFSVVGDPLRERNNTGSNTPAIKYYDFYEGSGLTISILVKGFGSENMSRTAMLNPTAGENGVRDFIRKTVLDAGGSPCPPLFLGVGIGGTMDMAAFLSKKALLRQVGERHDDAYYAELEKNITEDVNSLEVGPAGLGGSCTCLNTAVEYYPTHIAGLPVSISINCWADRKAILHIAP